MVKWFFVDTSEDTRMIHSQTGYCDAMVHRGSFSLNLAFISRSHYNFATDMIAIKIHLILFSYISVISHIFIKIEADLGPKSKGQILTL